MNHEPRGLWIRREVSLRSTLMGCLLAKFGYKVLEEFFFKG